MLTIRGSTQAWGHTHTLTQGKDSGDGDGTEQRVAEKRREEKRTEQTAIEQDRRQHNRTELKNRTEPGATERGISHLSAHVSQDSSSFRGQIRKNTS